MMHFNYIHPRALLPHRRIGVERERERERERKKNSNGYGKMKRDVIRQYVPRGPSCTGSRLGERNTEITVDRRLSSFRSTTQSRGCASRLPVPPSNICAGRSFAIFLLLSHSVSLYFSLIVAMQHWE